MLKSFTKFKNMSILPVGSYEYHGTKLPSDTDTIIANRIATDFANRIKKSFSGDITILPSFNFGLSLEHSGLPNTAYVSHKIFYDFFLELLNSIAKENSILLIINAHGGNTHTLAALEADFNYVHQNCKLIVFSLYPTDIKNLCSKLFGEFDVHAGSVEASLISFYQNKPRCKYLIQNQKKFSGLLRFFKTIDMHPEGIIKELPIVIADPRKGNILHNAIVKYLNTFINKMLLNFETFLFK